MCVLPGDSWTCDTLSTESSIITMRYETPELINSDETSYIGSTQDPSNLSEFVDSSYTTDSIPEIFNQELVSPYPLIEIEDTVQHMHETSANDTPVTNNPQTQDHTKQEYVMLKQLLRHLLAYKGITIPLELLASLAVPIPLRSRVNISKTTVNVSETSKSDQQGVLMNYLIQNYVQQNNLQNTIIADTKLRNEKTETSEVFKKNDVSEPMLNTSNDIPHVELDPENENNIILITDQSGHKRYLTIERYKALGSHLDPQFTSVIPCVINVRMPNTTDCVKYYTCDPEKVSVMEYSCPSFTAFNKYARVCDREAYKKCMEHNLQNANSAEEFNAESQINLPERNICTEHGKTKDITSESHYYMCYSPSNKLQGFKSIRLMCPNGLIFCQSRKVCTTRRLCKGIQSRSL